MIEKLAKKIYTYMSRHISVDEELEGVYRYGIEITISSVLNIGIVMAVAFLLGNPLSGLSYLICLILLRSFCGGYHADSYFKCNCLMIILYAISHFDGNLSNNVYAQFDIFDYADADLISNTVKATSNNSSYRLDYTKARGEGSLNVLRATAGRYSVYSTGYWHP